MQKYFLDKQNLILSLAVLWQFISIGLVATGVWPAEISWFNSVLLVILILILPRVKALGIFLLSLPFMVVLPNAPIAGLPMWRPLVAWLFIVVLAKYLLSRYKPNQSIFIWLKNTVQEIFSTKLNIWDKWLGIFFGLALLSLLVAQFGSHGFKQLLFLFNVYLLYLAVILAFELPEQWVKLKLYLQISFLITIFLGFVQYFATFFAEPYYFWQYWATLISATYYGQPLAEVLAYSNSWFSAEASGANSLRMFGILQDTHAFAVIVIFALGLWWAKANILPVTTRVRHILRDQGRWYFLVLVLVCFAFIASGTRGAWVAMLVPIVTTLILIYKFKARLLGALPLLSYTLIILLFLISPWITASFNWIRTFAVEDNFLKRVSSVYDLKEASNMGRLEIWQDSIVYSLRHPFGTGYGNFITSLVETENLTSYEEAAASKDLRYNLPQKFVTAHSLYLHLLVELGLLGLTLFLVFWWQVGKQIWRALTESEFAFTKLNLLLTSLAIILLWLLAYGLFDVTILNERVLLYLMSLLGLLNLALKTKPPTLF